MTLRFILIGTAILIAAAMWSFFDGVVIPAQEAESVAKQIPRGNLSDLYPRWLGARELLLHNRDPYSKEVTAEIQAGVWGRPLDPKNPADPVDESRFAYPLYVIFLLIPTVLLPFRTVQFLYVAVAVVLSVGSVESWFRFYGKTVTMTSRAVACILLLGSYPAVHAFLVQQPILVVSALVAGAMIAVARGFLSAAGIMLAFATIKPHAAIPIAVWLLFWAISKWGERKSLFISFWGTLGLCFAGSEFLLQGWLWKWQAGLRDYMRYAQLPPGQIQLIFGNFIGTGVAACLCFAVALFCWKARFDSALSDRFRLAPPLILTTYVLVTPVWHNYDHLLLMPAALLLFCWREEYESLKTVNRAIVFLAVIAVGWQWIAALTLSLLNMLSVPVQKWQVLPWLSILLFPPLALVSLLLLARSRLSRTDAVQ